MQQRRSARRFVRGAKPRLMLGGLAAAAGFSMSGCSSPIEPVQFSTVKSCTDAGMDYNLCAAGYNAAFVEHQRSAPQFQSKAKCEVEWGANGCTPLLGAPGANSFGSTGGAGIFVPALAGFVVSQAMQQRYYDTGAVDFDYYGGGYYGSPIYRNRSGRSVTVSRGSTGSVTMTPVNVNTATAARSGFGGRSFSRSFGG